MGVGGAGTLGVSAAVLPTVYIGGGLIQHTL